jgi:hypothetical protein
MLLKKSVSGCRKKVLPKQSVLECWRQQMSLKDYVSCYQMKVRLQEWGSVLSVLCEEVSDLKGMDPARELLGHKNTTK